MLHCKLFESRGNAQILFSDFMFYQFLNLSILKFWIYIHCSETTSIISGLFYCILDWFMTNIYFFHTWIMFVSRALFTDVFECFSLFIHLFPFLIPILHAYSIHFLKCNSFQPPKWWLLNSCCDVACRTMVCKAKVLSYWKVYSWQAAMYYCIPFPLKRINR